MEHVIQHIKSDLKNKYDEMFPKWYEAVSWTEPFILMLAGVHLLLLTFVILLRRHYRCQWILFILILLGLYFVENINSYGRDHWESLGISQNYFDTNGVFCIIFIAGPLLGIGFMQVVMNLFLMSDMIVQVKRMELRRKDK